MEGARSSDSKKGKAQPAEASSTGLKGSLDSALAKAYTGDQESEQKAWKND